MLPTPQLRPQSLGDILDGTFRLYRNNFVTFLGIAALLLVPLSILRVLFALLAGPDPFNQAQTLPPGVANIPLFQWLTVYSASTSSGLGSLLGLLQTFVLAPLMVAALVYVTAQRFLGRPASIADSLRFGVRGARFLYVLASQLLVGIGIAVGLLLPFFCILFLVLGSTFGVGAAFGVDDTIGTGAGIALGLVTVLLSVALALGAIYLSTRLLFFAQAIVVEGANPIDAITRSWRLVGGKVWRTFGIYLVLNLLVGLVGIAIFALLALGGAALGLAFNDPTSNFGLAISLIELIQLVTNLLIQPVLYIGATLLYYDLRVRKEGLDMEIQSTAAPPAYGNI